MRHNELYDRLINDLEIAVKAKSMSRDPYKLANDIGTATRSMGKVKSDFTIEEGWMSLTCYISLPGHLERLTQLLNFKTKSIEMSYSGLAPIESYYEQIAKNRTIILGQIQELIENKNLVFYDGSGTTPISEILEEELEYIHSESKRLQNCIKLLADKE